MSLGALAPGSALPLGTPTPVGLGWAVGSPGSHPCGLGPGVLSEGEVVTSARALCTFPISPSSSSQVLMTDMDPGSGGEKGPLMKGGWEGLGFIC